MNISYIILLMCCFILILSGVKIKKHVDDGEGVLSYKNTNCIKGAMALLIMFHHIYQEVSEAVPKVFVPMGYIGFITVAVFFFFSGYGLMYGLEHKEGYIERFGKRFLSIYVPVWIVTIVSVIGFGLLGEKYKWWEYILAFIGTKTITGWWFVQTILIFYLLFYVAFSLSKKREWERGIPLAIIATGTILYCFIVYLSGAHSSETASVFSFLFGLIYSAFYAKITDTLQKNYACKLVLIAVAFVGLFGGRLFLSFIGVENEVLHMLLRNVISIIFILLLICVLHRVDFHNKALEWFGKISFPIYLLHPIIGRIIKNFKGINPNIYVFLVVVLTIILSYCVTKISSIVLSRVSARR